MHSCKNCNSESVSKLREIGIHNELVPMSDGNLVRNFHAAQFVCENCSAVSTEYYPADRLQKYFKEDYDVSDTVQNCQVVLGGKKVGKHSVIHNNLLNECSTLFRDGNMLEIACGEGDLTRKFARQHKSWSCYGVDPSLNAELSTDQKNVKFIRDFFHPNLLPEQKFDVVVAHGILNRAPTLDLLSQIAELANENAIISVEVVTLENSMYAPFVWDHSFTFLEETFRDYLRSFGFIPFKEYDCGSTIQFVCKFESGKALPLSRAIDLQRKIDTKNHYIEHIETWSSIKENFEKHSNGKDQIAIFGAGLYSAVLYHLVDSSKIKYVVDEYKAGTQFNEHTVLNLNGAIEKKNTLFLLCCRERNVEYINQKISDLGYKVKNLH